MSDPIEFPVLGRTLRARETSATLRAWLDEHWHRPEHVRPRHPFSITIVGGAADTGGASGASPPGAPGSQGESSDPGDPGDPGITDRAAGTDADERVRATLPGLEQVWRRRGSMWEWRDREGCTGVRLVLGPDAARIRVWGLEAVRRSDSWRSGSRPSGPPSSDPQGSDPGRSDPSASEETVDGSPAPDSRASSASAFEAFAALHLAMCEALRASGLIPLHAAVVLPPAGGDAATTDAASAAAGGGMDRDGGAATALLGRSGVGKTTTLLRLTRAGWIPLAEDLSWVDPETLTLYGWDRGVRLWPETLEAFLPELAGESWRTGPDGKLFLAYDDLGCGEVRSGTLERLALLTRAPDGGSGWQPLAAAETVRALWEAVGVPLAPAARAAAATWIGDAARRLTAHSLGLDGDAPPVIPPGG